MRNYRVWKESDHSLGVLSDSAARTVVDKISMCCTECQWRAPPVASRLYFSHRLLQLESWSLAAVSSQDSLVKSTCNPIKCHRSLWGKPRRPHRMWIALVALSDVALPLCASQKTSKSLDDEFSLKSGFQIQAHWSNGTLWETVRKPASFETVFGLWKISENQVWIANMKFASPRLLLILEQGLRRLEDRKSIVWERP